MTLKTLLLEADFGIRKIDALIINDHSDWEMEKQKVQKMNYHGGKKTENYRILTHKESGLVVYLKTIKLSGMGMTYNTEVYLSDDKAGFRAEKWYNANIEWEGSSKVKQILNKILDDNKGVKHEVKRTMSKKAFEKILKDLQYVASDYEGDGIPFGDAEAFEVAANVLRDNPGMEDYIKADGVQDVQGWLANQF